VIQIRVFISGRVQGVSFRASTLHEALRYANLKGYVRNLPDGRVEAVFAGSPSEVQAMILWCAHGPKHAQVTEHQVIEESVDPSLTHFHIEY
jgi:acylphosphatase